MLNRTSLRDQVRGHLESRMLSGKLQAGERLSLPSLAEALNVSATPVREALTQLEQGGVVESKPNRGFFVPETSAAEAHQVYPVIASLESMMVASSTYSTTALQRIRTAQRAFEKARSPETMVRADLAFHSRLIEPSRNALAQRIVGELKCRVFFYELAHLRRVAVQSTGHHRTIVRQLSKGRLEAAAETVRDNWLQSLAYVEESIGAE